MNVKNAIGILTAIAALIGAIAAALPSLNNNDNKSPPVNKWGQTPIMDYLKLLLDIESISYAHHFVAPLGTDHDFPMGAPTLKTVLARYPAHVSAMLFL